MVVNNKETLKIWKQIYNLDPKLYKLNLVDTMWGFLTKNKNKNLEDVNFMKYNLQISNIHDWIESKNEPWGMMATKLIKKGKEVITQRKSKSHNKFT